MLLLHSGFSAYSQSEKRRWLNSIRREISMAPKYDYEKLKKIDSLRKQSIHSDNKEQYAHYQRLYEEFALFNFDSAYHYSKKMQAAAEAAGDLSLSNNSEVKLSYILLSSGMFKEVFDTLKNILPLELDNPTRAEYYILKARSYFDLADYSQSKIYSNYYTNEALNNLDSSLLLFDKNSFEYNYFKGLKEIRLGNIRFASGYFSQLINMPNLSLHQQAVINSTFSDVYIRKLNIDSAIILLAKAAIADIQSSTKETSAIFNLATLLFRQGDVENASEFIQKAVSDAKTYGARQRMVQLGTILPLIEAEKLSLVQQQKENISRYAIAITISFLFLIGLSIVIFRQIRKLKSQQLEINQKNVSLHHLVEEKEWLLREIHHRVKNNLHTITSLLESQAAYLQNDALTAIRDSQHRIYAMSLIHQKLYQPEKNVTDIDMRVYIHELVNYLKESFETGTRINFQATLEPIALDISLAVPLGLILNEAITNAVKYAFPNNQEGTVNISIRKTDAGLIQFSVTDNGIGLPEDFEISKTHSLGLKLIKGLSEDIVANFYLENKQGTRVAIEFLTDKSMQHLKDISVSGRN